MPLKEIYVMHICNMNIISTRHKASSRDICHWKNAHIKDYIVEGSKAYIDTTLLSQHDIFSN